MSKIVNPVIRRKKEVYEYYALDVKNAEKTMLGLVKPLPLELREPKRIGFPPYSYGSVPVVVPIEKEDGKIEKKIVIVSVPAQSIYGKFGEGELADITRPLIIVSYDLPKPWVEPVKTAYEIADIIAQKKIPAPETPSDAYSELRRWIYAFLTVTLPGIQINQSIIAIPLKRETTIDEAVKTAYIIADVIIKIADSFIRDRIIPYFGYDWAVYPSLLIIVIGRRGEEYASRIFTLKSIAELSGIGRTREEAGREEIREIKEVTEEVSKEEAEAIKKAAEKAVEEGVKRLIKSLSNPSALVPELMKAAEEAGLAKLTEEEAEEEGEEEGMKWSWP